MNDLQVILPLGILLISFAMRLAVNREVTSKTIQEELSFLPFDIIFLALSLSVAVIISTQNVTIVQNSALTYLLYGVFASIIVVALCRFTRHKVDERNLLAFIIAWLFNMGIATYGINMVIRLIISMN